MTSIEHGQQLIDDARRDAWLAELWPTVREYRAGEVGHDPTEDAAAVARREQLDTFFGDEPADRRAPGRRWAGAA